MHRASDVFGVSGDTLAAWNVGDPQTPSAPAIATSSKATLEPPLSAFRALTDPQGSAIFWILAAAILGLVLVSGRLHVEAAVGGRAGK